jgi:hypothetical protein
MQCKVRNQFGAFQPVPDRERERERERDGTMDGYRNKQTIASRNSESFNLLCKGTSFHLSVISSKVDGKDAWCVHRTAAQEKMEVYDVLFLATLILTSAAAREYIMT